MSSSPSKTALPGDLPSKPPWLKVPLPAGEVHGRLKRLTRELSLHTVCEEARCPNLGECWSGEHATMTIMVLGDQCTRRCRFCAVETVDRAPAPDPAEPANVGRAVGRLNLDYVVITSVDRDDLPDGGAGHYSQCVAEIRARAPQTIIETLAPDYQGSDLAGLLPGREGQGSGAHPDVFAHNVEVVPRLQRKVRDPRCSFERSLQTLEEAKQRDDTLLTKSSLMVGLSESADEVSEAMALLRAAHVDFLTLGQYLRPSKQHVPVHEYLPPARFEELRQEGLGLGFQYVAAGPLVRSSYKAGEFFATRVIRQRRAEPVLTPA